MQHASAAGCTSPPAQHMLPVLQTSRQGSTYARTHACMQSALYIAGKQAGRGAATHQQQAYTSVRVCLAYCNGFFQPVRLPLLVIYAFTPLFATCNCFLNRVLTAYNLIADSSVGPPSLLLLLLLPLIVSLFSRWSLLTCVIAVAVLLLGW